METKTFLIITIVFIILFVVIIIVRKKVDNKPKKGSNRELAMKYIDTFFADNPQFIMKDDIKRTYKLARKIIYKQSEKEFTRLLQQKGITVKESALNILQNCALFNIKAATASEIINADYNAIGLYNAVNDKKLDLGYISEEQHADNSMLIVKKFASPLR